MTPKRLAGIAIVFLLVAGAVGALLLAGGGEQTCELVADDVGVLAEGMVRNDDVNDIARASEAGTFDGGPCQDLVETMVEEPGDDVTFRIGGSEVTLRGAQLTAVEIAGTPTCASWISDQLSTLCDAGTIDPPPPLFGI